MILLQWTRWLDSKLGWSVHLLKCNGLFVIKFIWEVLYLFLCDFKIKIVTSVQFPEYIKIIWSVQIQADGRWSIEVVLELFEVILD